MIEKPGRADEFRVLICDFCNSLSGGGSGGFKAKYR
jgi:hypothetical protein